MSRKKKELDFGKDGIWHILLTLAPPVMLAQLIQAFYNIVDSFFVGRCSETGLTALSIVYPLQLLMIALAVGTGVGINTLMAHFNGIGKKDESEEVAGVGTNLSLLTWIIFAVISYFIMPFYGKISTDSEEVIREVIIYGRIVNVFSMGVFFESVWTKVLQANGNMKKPMIAQIAGAVVNIILDPVFIFGVGFIPAMGIKGAALATVIGQVVAALFVMPGGYRRSPGIKKYPAYIKRIYYLGFPNMLMQSAYTLYIFGLNLILKTFSDQAVTVLGLYYKWQSFFFIPLGAMQTCVVPVISYNFGAGLIERCKKTLYDAIIFGWILMSTGVLCFELIPAEMLSVFSRDPLVISIGINAFHIIGISFIPLVSSLTFPVYFQAIGSFVKSSALTVLRTVVLFVPLAYIFSRAGLDYFWLTFPVTDTITSITGYVMLKRQRINVTLK